ncbi:MAG: hypothetical protein COV74_03580 [Candidatus Omnitrophica bacterium CG11_big_fil_rev_8_21_14_0_20_45_26]|uniref:Response regulatory domain-containing protein n=1 Tax=Candidatus Abzuiibacterium crystallinum TaxID=1974748 RepID=A0A2H0LQM4_9BACT|nr:MAG: hypothetical protein COV74_03580 [Candidatus Omnitrophica bacterium CG11_big_fil_rev_8_21_14_0_20_45_26]PIW63517.1 MAG: hypothetical protein COW12_10155 [Candidatus Omnitrophica bacterium CG12_big_fil_rev_8_21_14_0_65_45_16]
MTKEKEPIHQKKIIVIDDEKDICDFLCDVLKEHGFDVTAVYSGSDALENLQAIEPDLIMLDVILPDVDGISVYEMYHKKTGNLTPVIFFTTLAGSLPPNFIRQMHGIPYALVPKPIKEDILIKEIKKLLS